MVKLAKERMELKELRDELQAEIDDLNDGLTVFSEGITDSVDAAPIVGVVYVPVLLFLSLSA